MEAPGADHSTPSGALEQPAYSGSTILCCNQFHFVSVGLHASKRHAFALYMMEERIQCL